MKNAWGFSSFFSMARTPSLRAVATKQNVVVLFGWPHTAANARLAARISTWSRIWSPGTLIPLNGFTSSAEIPFFPTWTMPRRQKCSRAQMTQCLHVSVCGVTATLRQVMVNNARMVIASAFGTLNANGLLVRAPPFHLSYVLIMLTMVRRRLAALRCLMRRPILFMTTRLQNQQPIHLTPIWDRTFIPLKSLNLAPPRLLLLLLPGDPSAARPINRLPDVHRWHVSLQCTSPLTKQH